MKSSSKGGGLSTYERKEMVRRGEGVGTEGVGGVAMEKRRG